MIDQALEQKPADFDALLKLLSEMGCEVTQRGKTIRLKAPGWKNREYEKISVNKILL